MVKPCFLWKDSQSVHYVVDVPGCIYGQGSSVEEAVASAISNGVAECEIDFGDVEL